MRAFILVLWVYALSACATAYKGDGEIKHLEARPLTLVGLEAIVAVDGHDYSLASVIQALDSSANTLSDLRTALEIKAVSNPLKIIGLATLAIGAFGSFNHSNVLALSGLGLYTASLGLDIYAHTKLSQGIDQFNYEQREKLMSKGLAGLSLTMPF